MTVMPGYQMLWTMAILILLESVPTMANDIFVLGGQGGHALLDEDDEFDDDDDDVGVGTRMNIGQDTLVTDGIGGNNENDSKENDDDSAPKSGAPSAPVAGDMLGISDDAIMVSEDAPIKDTPAVNAPTDDITTDAP